MWEAILKFLKATAKTAGKAGMKLGKEAIKSKLKPLENIYKEGLIKGVGKTALEQSGVSDLYNAFKSQLGKKGELPKETGFGLDQQLPSLSQGYAQQQDIGQGTTQITPPNRELISLGNVGGGTDQGILAFLGQSGVGERQGQNLQTIIPNRLTIPSQYQQFTRQPGMQYTQLQPTIPVIPEQYKNFGQSQETLQPKKEDIGFVRGLIDALTSQARPEGFGDERQGRKTAYQLGALIPSIMTSKLGLDTPAEAAEREQLMKYRDIKGTPNATNLLKMAQTEAYRQMGGGILGQAKMATDPKFKQNYLDLVDKLYKQYLIQFGIGGIASLGEENIDTGESTDFGTTDW